jgi:hypothetical protein
MASNVGKAVEGAKLTLMVGMQNDTVLLGKCLALCSKVKHSTPNRPELLLLDYYQGEVSINIYPNFISFTCGNKKQDTTQSSTKCI